MKKENDAPEDGLVDTLGDILRNNIEAYQRSPVLRMLVELHPDLAVAEAGILAAYS
jgi:hypothetical protein